MMIKAKLEQLEQISELYRVVIASQAELEPYFYKEAAQRNDFIESLIVNEDSDILITLSGETVTGFSAIREVESPGYPMFIKRKSAYVLDLVIKPEFRRRGLAEKLLSDSKEWQEEKQLDYLELCVLESNEAAVKLYEKFGFHSFSRQMIVK